MNKILSLLTICLILAISFSSCKKKTTTNTNGGNACTGCVEVPIDRSDTTSLPFGIPGGASLDFTVPPFGPVLLDTFATKVDEFIGPYGFTKADMLKVNVTKLSMVIENAPGQTFNFIKDAPISLRIYVDSFNGTTPKMIASRDNIPQGVTTMDLVVSTDDIKDYFRADYMEISAAFKTADGESLASGTKFRVNYSFKVTAKKP
ncbi:MAG: hypothetical protein IT257_05235 [Chitinophagaceae bacterium]|nr:hypothetical protein [Chitinophagaceae bacterium]